MREIIFANINKIRTQGRLPLFEQEDKLIAEAERIASEIFTQRGSLSASLLPGSGVLYFMSEDPNILPKGTKDKIENNLRNFRRIGIGVIFGKNQEIPHGGFWVAILLKE